ncbi:MAG: polyisoprenoid-binding protein [Hyphomonadaceae bacterium]|nr:polyisoprenoid-binding protein [Hyphomonadaceae bacterium]
MRLALLLPLALSACAFTATQTPQTLQSLPAGAYQLERPHGSLTFRVKHLGLSWYTARFADFDATLEFDPKAPAASHVKAIINPLSVRTDNAADPGWDKRIGQDMLKGADSPQIIFDSTSIETTGPFTGKVTGALTLAGVTRPVTLDVTYNGGMDSAVLYAGRPAVGFSARGMLKRSAFGLTRYSEFVGDEVEIVIEAEFTRR